MSRNKKPLPLLQNILITDYAAEGKCVARVDDMVVFVPWAVPGDIVDLQVRRKKHSFMEAEIVRFERKSAKRIEPFCSHFGVCGGCKWQQVAYEDQLAMKQQQVRDQLARIGKVELPEFRPILGDSGVPQQARLRLRQQALPHQRRDFSSSSRRRTKSQGTAGRRFPHHRRLRQDTAHREMLADGRSSQRN